VKYFSAFSKKIAQTQTLRQTTSISNIRKPLGYTFFNLNNHHSLIELISNVLPQGRYQIGTSKIHQINIEAHKKNRIRIKENVKGRPVWTFINSTAH